MDPKILELNGKAMAKERLQAGAEITLSGRFFWNLLAVVPHIVETLSSEEHGANAPLEFLPPELTFGDSWIIERLFRVDRQQPDVVLKLPGRGGDSIRMVGELKYCLNIGFQSMIDEAESGKGERFRGILGQLVDYMLGQKLKYGFISNYKETIFLQLGLNAKGDTPCIYFSDIIRGTDILDDLTESLSLRLALFHLTRLTCSPTGADWQVGDNVLQKTAKWIAISPEAYSDLGTPFGNRTVADTTLPHLNLSTPARSRTSTYADDGRMTTPPESSASHWSLASWTEEEQDIDDTELSPHVERFGLNDNIPPVSDIRQCLRPLSNAS